MVKSKLGRDREPRQVFALIEWLSESPNRGLSFTHNVPIEWVQGYDPEERDESYVVQWQQGVMPKGGWNVYDGKLHETSVDEAFLKREMQRLEREADHHGNQTPDINSPAFKDMLAAAVKQAVSSCNKTPQKPKEDLESRETQTQKFQIGKSLVVDRADYNMAKVAPSPGKMVGILLKKGFSKNRLIKSSYAGQRRTFHGVTKVKPGLKKYQKMQDIQNFVLERFPYVTQGNFSSIVNSFLGESANQTKEVTLHEESEEEVE